MEEKEREIWVGKSRIYLGEDNIIYFTPVGDHDENTAAQVSNAVFKLEKLAGTRTHILIDLNNAGKLSFKARKIYRSNSERENTGKSAMFGLHPVARLIASFILGGISKNKKISFFTTKQQALDWLKK